MTKPVQTTAAKKAADAARQNKGDASTEAETPRAPADAPDADQGQAVGEVGSGLPDSQKQHDATHVVADTLDRLAMLDGLGLDRSGQPKPDIAVVCHRKDGRRRAGQKWPHGETRVSSADFTAFQLDQLRGDPAFTVFHIEEA